MSCNFYGMIYLYKNPETGEIKGIDQKMSDTHKYFEGGIEWDRVYTSPQVAISFKTDGHDLKTLMRRTHENKGGTIGDIMDIADEARAKRVQYEGIDSWGEKTRENYKKKTGKDLADHA